MTKCVICDCTYVHACDNGCAWAPDKHPQVKALDGAAICTNCAEILDQLLDYARVAHTFHPGRLAAAIKAQL